jgi:hypothetical protein
VSWVYFLFILLFVLALVPVYRHLPERGETGRRPSSMETFRLYGPAALVVALFIAYVLTGMPTRAFIVLLLIVGTVGPVAAASLEQRGDRVAHDVRMFVFLVVLALVALIVLTLLLRFFFVLLVAAAMAAVLVIAAFTLGLIGNGRS